MRRSLFVFLFLAVTMGHAQTEPASWFEYPRWLTSFNAGDVVKHEEYLKQHAFSARMHRPFSREAGLEMALRQRVGGGLTPYRTINFTEKEVHQILKGRDGKSWVEVVIQFDQGTITAIELHQIISPEPSADAACHLDPRGVADPQPK